MGDRLRVTIHAGEAVELIRSGWTDVKLMRKYNISARSLERLLAKLVEARKISRTELERRILTSHRSHVVDIVSTSVTPPKAAKRKAKINASEVVACIRSRMSDLELMDKYNVSSRGLRRLFQRLVSRGDIEQAELDQRRLAFSWAEITFVASEEATPESLEEIDTESPSPASRLREWRHRNRVPIAAALGAIGGILFCLAVALIRMGTDTTANIVLGHQKTAESAGSSEDTLPGLADQMITVLESVARGDHALAHSSRNNEVSEYDDCLRECDKDLSHGDDGDRAILINCRKRCVVMYSERMRRIRELYHLPHEQQR